MYSAPTLNVLMDICISGVWLFSESFSFSYFFGYISDVVLLPQRGPFSP